ncbi:MAG: DUF4126 domain-containing protein [Steroidobacteraceae bacterium]
MTINGDVFLSIALGIGLAAAVGLRVFLPLLFASVASHLGWIPLSADFHWLGSDAALIAFGVATLAEVAAYYIPGLDHALDAIAAPVALVAGTVVAAAVFAPMPPLVKWSLSIIAGGGAAGLTQGSSTVLRAKSAVLTGGLGNPVVATLELGGSAVLSAMAIWAPVVALVAVLLLAVVLVRLLRRRR